MVYNKNVMETENQARDNFSGKSPKIAQTSQNVKQIVKPWTITVIVSALILVGGFVWWYANNQKLTGLSPTNSTFTEKSNPLTNLIKYKDARYSYLYPQTLVSAQRGGGAFNAVEVVTKESVVRDEKVIENCEGECYSPTLTSLGWDNEKKLLESNPLDGTVNCVEGVNGKSLCEVKTHGENKFLIRYTGHFSGESVIEKTYIIYKNDIRYEISPPNLGGQGTAPALFKSIENEPTQRIYEDIVKSLIFL